MEWIYAVIYIVIAIMLLFIYERIFPYEEDITLGYSDRYQRKMYYSSMAIGVVFWPMLVTIFLLTYVIRLAMNFVKWLRKKNIENE
jgi:hypothetical protein